MSVICLHFHEGWCRHQELVITLPLHQGQLQAFCRRPQTRWRRDSCWYHAVRPFRRISSLGWTICRSRWGRPRPRPGRTLQDHQRRLQQQNAMLTRQGSLPSASCLVRYVIAVFTHLWAVALQPSFLCGGRAAALCVGAPVLVSGSQERTTTRRCELKVWYGAFRVSSLLVDTRSTPVATKSRGACRRGAMSAALAVHL